ncbi:MAG: HAMP domain-containing protein [Ignavibacteriales bacterium]|nr:HAMP domain-containing protein [Ignavibacteriales bacterium]
MKKLKTKILLGLVFLLIVIFLLSTTGIFSIYYLSEDSKAIIKDNYASVEHSTRMLDAIENIFTLQLSRLENANKDTALVKAINDSLQNKKEEFVKYLGYQKNNITESGEDKIVSNVIDSYHRFINVIDSINYQADNFNTYDVDKLKSSYITATSSIEEIYKLNMTAIYNKNAVANKTADNVSLYMAIAATSSILITIVFIFYFPSYITTPITELTKKIKDISNKKYDQRIDIQTNDELNTLADAFNIMAIKLQEYQAQQFDELLLEKRRMETLLANLQDGTLLLDNTFNILHANHKFCQLSGLSITELLGTKITDLKKNNQFLTQINSLDIKNILHSKNKKAKPFSLLINNRTEYFQILLLDISKENRLDTYVEPSGYIILIQNITKYEERDLAKTNLIATISHELKTPLSSINLSIKLLEDDRVGELNKEQKGLTESIKIQSNRILNLVNEVLDFTQAETGHIKLKIKPCEVSDIVELGTFAILMLINEKEINLNISIPDDISKVKCDLEKTVWVIVNLLNNAVRYSSQKGKIKISAKSENKFVTISIKDEGPGVSVEEQSRIFEKYVKSKSESAKGTGLGLAIAKEFVEVQGGIIGVESTPGKGSTFYFTLPTT